MLINELDNSKRQTLQWWVKVSCIKCTSDINSNFLTINIVIYEKNWIDERYDIF